MFDVLGDKEGKSICFPENLLNKIDIQINLMHFCKHNSVDPV